MHTLTGLGADEDTLRNVARDGEMDYAKWPGIIDGLLQRLNQIVRDEFPIPRPFPSLSRAPATVPSSPMRVDPSQSIIDEAAESESTLTSTPSAAIGASQPPPSTPQRSLPPIPLLTDSATTTASATYVPESLPPSQDAAAATAAATDQTSLPAVLVQLLQSITTTLRASFSHRPPHTIQRLAELVLEPRKHYKTLPAWLRAVDRVVNVSSSADIFPLSDGPRLANGVINGELGGGILWKNDETRNGSYNPLVGGDLGSDESLGGALLTPIPWLRHDRGSSIEEEDDAGAESDANMSAHEDGTAADLDLELDSVHASGQDPLATDERQYDAISQGPYVHMEQDTSTVFMPLHGTLDHLERDQLPPDADGDGGAGDGQDEGDDAVPHGRGPQIVGAVDMGNVSGKEVELKITTALEEEEDDEKAADITPMDVYGNRDDNDNDKNSNLAQKSNASKKHYEEEEEQQQQQQPQSKKTKISRTAGGQAEDEDEDMVFVGADGSIDDSDKIVNHDDSEANNNNNNHGDKTKNTTATAFDALR